jgi:lysophospholipase L1-like esterase
MTKRNNAIGILTILILTALIASAASNQPKVVFIGDQFTYYWTSAFAANPNWINQGWASPLHFNCYVSCQPGASEATLTRFQTDVIDLNPAIVHIMVGSDDVDFVSSDGIQLISPYFLNSMQTMIKMAKAANIQVILGIESPEWPVEGKSLMEPLNSIIATLAAQNNIPVINYGDALCACVGSTGGIGVGENFAILTPYMTLTSDAYEPNAEGYALMTQMAEATINTLGLTLEGGYLQNELQPFLEEETGPKAKRE